jgi:hypothetical protein
MHQQQQEHHSPLHNKTHHRPFTVQPHQPPSNMKSTTILLAALSLLTPNLVNGRKCTAGLRYCGYNLLKIGPSLLPPSSLSFLSSLLLPQRPPLCELSTNIPSQATTAPKSPKSSTIITSPATSTMCKTASSRVATAGTGGLAGKTTAAPDAATAEAGTVITASV